MSVSACGKPAVAIVLFIAVSACANGGDVKEDRLCSRAICGCWEGYTMQAMVSIVDGDGRPAPVMTLSCAADRRVFGKSDAAGRLRLVAAGRTSPGCGYIAECETASLTDQEGSVQQTFALTPLLRGEKVIADGYTLSAAPVNAQRE